MKTKPRKVSETGAILWANLFEILRLEHGSSLVSLEWFRKIKYIKKKKKEKRKENNNNNNNIVIIIINEAVPDSR